MKMNNITLFGMHGWRLCAVSLIVAMAVFSCPADGGTKEKTLSGTITILQDDEPVFETTTGKELTADYTGAEAVNYQWKWGNTNVGENSPKFTPGEAGDYTVTVSASGYKSKTSASVEVSGETIPELTGTISIQIDGETVTTAETGQTLTAAYSGNEAVRYQWFRGEDSLNSTAATGNRTYTPSESGSYTVRVSLPNYLTKISAPVAVSGEAKITITFNLNGGSGTASTKAIAVGAAIGELPADPQRASFAFTGWYSTQSGGTEVTAATTFDEAATVYARWNFVGGTPVVVGDTLVHENPLVTAGTSFAGTISEEDGSISGWTAGAFDYLFPTTGEGYNISDYARFEIQITGVTSTADGSAINFRQYGSNTTYGGDGIISGWLGNYGGTIKLQLRGAGTSGGFSVQHNQGSATMEVSIVSITFYKEPKYTVTFDLDGGTGTVPTGSIEIYNGFSLGADFPSVAPTKEDYTFVAWKNGEGHVVTSTTLITGSWTIKADWQLTSAMDSRRIELITTKLTNAPVYGFNLPDGDSFSNYDRVTFKLKMSPTSEYPGGRLRAWGTYVLTGFNNNSRPGMENAAAANNGSGKLLNAATYTDYSTVTTWTSYTIEFSTRNTTAEGNATGLVGVAFGLIANNASPTNVGTRTYYVKDIVLSNSDGTKTVPALLPTDPLWNGNGETAYVTQDANDTVTRQLMPYEED